MSETFTITAKQLCDDLKLECIYDAGGLENLEIKSRDVNRCGQQLMGYLDYFDAERIQVLGLVEWKYLNGLDSSDRFKRMSDFFELDFPALIVTRDLEIFPELLEAAKENRLTVFLTKEATSSFLAALIAYLNKQLAPRITRHGVLVEIYGEGVLILGESGVGKSETAIELVKRGHRLVADDAVEIKRVSAISLVGTSPKVIRHFIELRGIGIVDVRRIFGMGAVKDSEKIDLIVNLEAWNTEKQYDRLGLVDEKTEILGIEVNSITIPVKPGRNLAVIIEVAAMNNRQKKMGYNAARELLHHLGMDEGYEPKSHEIDIWQNY